MLPKPFPDEAGFAGKAATGCFRETVNALEQTAQEKGSDLPYNLNQYHMEFNLGNKGMFGVNCHGSHAQKVHMKLPEEFARDFTTNDREIQRYDSQFNEALTRPKTAGKISVSDVEALLPLTTGR